MAHYLKLGMIQVKRMSYGWGLTFIGTVL